MPFTPCNRMLSAILKASTIVVLGSASVSKRSFGMTINVSTCSRNRSIPFSACIARRRPSKANGFVTIATVSAPRSRATSAMTGAPPVPVPPPSPAAMNTMSAPFRASAISSVWSSAAARPTSGSLPAPSPRVSWRPMSSLRSASLNKSACASVFTATNSTPRSSESIMRFTALTPPPPIPITLMTAMKL